MNLALESDEMMINWGQDVIKKMQQKTRSSLIE